MSDFILQATTRTVLGKGVQAIRKRGRVPGVVYGHNAKTVALDVDRLALQRVYHEAGESSLIELQIDEQPAVRAIIHDLQYDPQTSAIAHVDFQQVKMTEKMQVEVALRFLGESPAVKELGGTLVKVHDAVKVEGLPADLVKEIDVDIARLRTFDDAIHFRDLPLPAGLTLEDNPDELVAHVEAPRSEAELAELETAVEEDVSKVEKVEAPKAEEADEAPTTTET